MTPPPPPGDALELLWYLTAPDGRAPWSPAGTREVDLSYFRQLAGAIDRLGYDGALLATGPHDVHVLAASLVSHTDRMRFLLAVHPPLLSPMLAAKMTVTLDQFSRGRVLLNIVNGDGDTLAAMGSSLAHDERYAYTSEWIPIWRAALAGETVDVAGRHLTVRNGRLALPSVQRPTPPLWFGGSSPAALDVAAEHIDTYLVYGDAPEVVAERLQTIGALAGSKGRTLRYGIRLYLVVRDTDEEAWDEAARLLRTMDAETIGRIQARLGASDSHVQQHQLGLHPGAIPDDPHDLEFAPSLWSGFGLVRAGAATAIVGSPETVAARLRDFQAIGISTFILSGVPLLEEAYRVAETVVPLLRGAGAPDAALGYGALVGEGRR
ncbi:MAG TPA: LLM class flavin-dependent oxidoreductase [Capillimicrobium sp.]|nr:LLM class flavin-dependent oxidoreductase [Capillimicrobium sp.]